MAVNDPVTELRALLDQFRRSSCGDMFIRSGGLSVFMARPGGGPNPMRAQPVPAAVMPAPEVLAPVTAPHLGLFEPACVAGDTVPPGGRIGAIDVLGRKTEVASTAGGRVAALCAGKGALVEYGEVLVEMVAA